jgi:hypothetical protein
MNKQLEKAKIYISKTNTSIESIGTKQEKTLHQTIKYYLTTDESLHERKIENKIVDIYKEGEIFEIQTQGFDKMRDKLSTLLPKYHLTIVFPIAHIKTIHSVNNLGVVEYTRKSPKKQSPFEIFKELYKIKQFLNSDNLHFKIIMFESEEIRDIVPKKHVRSKGYKRSDQIVKDIIKEYDIYSKKDFNVLLDEINIPFEFRTLDVKKHTKVSVKTSTLVLNILLHLNLIEKIGSRNRYILYKRKNQNAKA